MMVYLYAASRVGAAYRSNPPANTKSDERLGACISVHSGSDAGIKLQVMSNDISQATIENGTSWTILYLRPLNTQIDKRVELFGWIGIQGHRKKPGRKQSAFIVFIPCDTNIRIQRKFQMWRKIPVSR